MKEAKKNVGIALQGGGAHGAFTWGVLDRLLEEENLVADPQKQKNYWKSFGVKLH